MKDRPVIGNGVVKSAKSINGSLVVGDETADHRKSAVEDEMSSDL